MNYVRNAWYVASWSEDLVPGKPFSIRILDEPIVIWRTPSGTLAALEDRCVHRLAPLSVGRCEGESLRCMYHGMLYSTAGKVTEIPGQDIIPPHAQVRSYPVVDRHSWIWVWMGDSAAADPSLIPPAVGADDPNYLLGRGEVNYTAEARLVNDNLLDFSHLTYVHASSFEATDTWVNSKAQVRQIERGVNIQRWNINDHDMVSGETLDRWTSYDYLVPGIMLMISGLFEAGSAEKYGQGPPDMSKAKRGVTFTNQAVTPLTPKTSRYLFSFGPHRDHGDEALRDLLISFVNKAFAEDKAMIEAQQRIVDATPDPTEMPTAADKAITLFNRLVERTCQAERARSKVATPAAPVSQQSV